MANLKVTDTQDIKLDHGSLFNTEEAREKYINMNGKFCFYNKVELTTDKTVIASAWYKIEYNGIPLSLHIQTNFLLKLTHNQKTNVVKNRVMGVVNENEHSLSIHSVDEDFDGDLPFELDRNYHYRIGLKINDEVLEIIDFIMENFKKRVHVAVNYYFMNLPFYAFLKCQNKIIDKVIDENISTGWDNYLACSVDPTASHYTYQHLYPERHYEFCA